MTQTRVANPPCAAERLRPGSEWRDAYDRGVTDGFGLGYDAAEADMAAAWHAMATRAIAAADPDSPQARERARHRILAAEEGCRADARAHWQRFMSWARTCPRHVLGDPDCPAPLKAAAESFGRTVRWKWQRGSEAA